MVARMADIPAGAEGTPAEVVPAAEGPVAAAGISFLFSGIASPARTPYEQGNSMKPYWKITLWYLAFGIVWIFFSDRMIESLAPSKEALTFLQTIKGWGFVLMSAALIFALTKEAFERQLKDEREKMAIFKKTVAGVYHIVLNYLNRMQLVTLEAERTRDFDPAVLQHSREISEDAARELAKLNDITIVTPEEIEAVVYRDLQRKKPFST